MALTAGAESAGTVVVSTPVAAGPDEAWRALTDRERIEQWFGVPSGELAPGAFVRLDFEDGDFFDLEVEEVAKPVLRFAWRFMGCGPRDAIAIEVEPAVDGAVVTVTDHEPNRSAAEAAELAEGWEDFTARLARHLATGERTRYDWRSDVDVWTELQVDADTARRIVIGSAGAWLPVDGAANLFEADALVLQDGTDPAAFAIGDIQGTGPASVRFTARPQGMSEAITCRIDVSPRGSGSALVVGQSGFRQLDASPAEQRRIRERFANAWLAAVLRARALVNRSVAGGGQPGPPAERRERRPSGGRRERRERWLTMRVVDRVALFCAGPPGAYAWLALSRRQSILRRR